MARSSSSEGGVRLHPPGLWPCCLSIVLTFTLLTRAASAYNVDEENVKVIDGPMNNSHFGFTAYIHRTSTGSLSLVVGAPGEDGKNGSVYTVDLQDVDLGSPDQPPIRRLNTVRSNQPLINKLNDTSMEGEMYGFYVGGSSQHSLVCAPRWADVRYADQVYLLLGRCVFYEPDFDRAMSQASQEPLFSEKNRDYFYNTIRNNSVAEMGMAADLTPAGQTVVGLPGKWDWTGGFLMSSGKGSPFRIGHSGSDDNLPPFSLLGYSISVADFCRPPRFCVAAGAPRFELRGGAFVYERIGPEFKLLANVSCEQVGAYFGAAVLGADVDGDGEAELLVGAPYFTDDSSQAASDKKTRFADEGRVFVYKNTRPQITGELQFKLVMELEGSNLGHARFGSSVANVGDLNHDGYNDIAVGAPREDEDRGALYVYQGGARGLSAAPSQRVLASTLHPGLRSFAAFIGNSLDIDNNDYSDLVVGSPMSDQVVLLRTRPILDLMGELQILPPLILPNDTHCSPYPDSDGCFQLRLCFNYTGPSLPSNAMVKYGLLLDTQAKRRKRIRVQVGNSSHEAINGNVTVQRDRNTCVDFTAISLMTPRVRDPFTLVRVEGEFSLHQPVLDPGSLQPIFNSSRPRTVQAEAGFSSGCRKQTECETDLKLSVTPRFLADESFITINLTRRLELDVLLSNQGEVAYSTTVDFLWSSGDLRYLDVRAEAGADNRLLCDPGSQRATGLHCGFQQQVSQGRQLRFTLLLNTSALSPLLPQLTINASASSLSTELSPLDNHASVRLPVWVVANVSLTGLSSPTGVAVPVVAVQAHEEPVLQEVAHTYTLINRGPSFLPSPTLLLEVPYYTLDERALLSDARAEIKLSDGSTQACLRRLPLQGQGTTPSTDVTTTSLPPSTSRQPAGGSTGDPGLTLPPQSASRRRKRSSEVTLNAADDGVPMDESPQQTRLTCAEALCARFQCQVSGLDPGTSVSVNVTLSVDLGALPLSRESGSLWLESQGTLLEPDHPRLFPWDTNITATVATRFSPVYREPVAIWIIVLAFLGGLLLLILVGIACWKAGFFKREKKDEMKEWKRESVNRQSMAVRRPKSENNGKELGPDS